MQGGYDYNGCGWRCNNEEFKAKYGFDYGEDDVMYYLYERGIVKALRLIERYEKKKLSAEAKQAIMKGLERIVPQKKEIAVNRTSRELPDSKPFQITIELKDNRIEIVQK